ncbi:hypothetical protein PQR05_34935 [Paraburkholderia sediminicola]
MTIGAELEAQILRYYHVEKWRCGTIARQLHVHRGTVQRVLAQAGLPRIGPVLRPSQIDAYLPFIHETLKKFPSLTASRLYAMVTERGYRGNLHHFRHQVAIHLPRPTPEAYLRLRTLPGEQGQVDWAHFDHLQIGRARRPLMAFVMMLSWSRQIYRSICVSSLMPAWTASWRATLAPSRHGPGCRRSSCTTILKAPSLNARAMRSALIRRCSRSPRIIGTSPVPWQSREETRRGASNVPSAMYARTSLRHANSLISKT